MVVMVNGPVSKTGIPSSSLGAPTMNIEEAKKVNNIAGIYCFHNLVNNKYYVGQAIRLRKRLLSHLCNYNNKKLNNPLYQAFDEYGLDNFEYLVLESFDENNYNEIKKELDKLEIKYIKKYNSYNPNGYNQTLEGDGGILGYKMTKEQRDKISKGSSEVQEDGRNKIYIYNTDTNLYHMFISATYASKYFNIPVNTLNKGNLENRLVHDKFIIARDETTLKKRVNEFKSGNKKCKCKISKEKFINYFNKNKNKTKEEMAKDLNVSRKTIYNYINKWITI